MELSSTTPNLDTLPYEIIDMICGYIDSDRPLAIHRTGYLTLRKTCKSLYAATHYQFKSRLFSRYRYPGFYIDPNTLTILFHLSEVHYLRNCFTNLTLWEPSRYTIYDQQYHTQINELKEELYDYLQSCELSYLLTGIFENFARSEKLTSIDVWDAYEAVFAALKQNPFAKPLIRMHIVPQNIRHHHPSRPWLQFPDLSGILQSVILPSSVHEKGSKVSSPSFLRLLDAVKKVPELELHGCADMDPYRLCHGCLDVFDNGFRRVFYPNLRTFKLWRMYVHGGSLHSFLRMQQFTLTSIDMCDVRLMSSSWHRIFNTLRTISELDQLKLSLLSQKGWIGFQHDVPISPYTLSEFPNLPSIVVSSNGILPFLNDSILFHRTFWSYYPTKVMYIQVNLLIIPGISRFQLG